MKSISPSSAQTYQICPRKYRLQHLERWRGEPSASMEVGSLVDYGVKQVWTGEKCPELYEPHHNVDEVEIIQAEAMVSGYSKNFIDDQPGTHYPDFRIEADGFEGILDCLSISQSGKKALIRELKTTGQKRELLPNSVRMQTLEMNDQLTIYSHLVRQHFPEVEEVEVNYEVIWRDSYGPKMRKQIRRKKDESEEDYEERKLGNTETLNEYRVRLMDAYEIDFETRFAQVRYAPMATREKERIHELRHVLMNMSEDDAYIRNPNACSMYGGCQYVGVCTGQERIEENFSQEQRND